MRVAKPRVARGIVAEPPKGVKRPKVMERIARREPAKRAKRLAQMPFIGQVGALELQDKTTATKIQFFLSISNNLLYVCIEFSSTLTEIGENEMLYFFQQDGDKLLRLDKMQSGCWIHIAPPFNVAELEKITERLAIPMDFLTDSLDIDERARFELEEDVKLIVINTPILNESVTSEPTLYITVPIGIILTPEHVVTLTAYDTPVLRQFVEGRVRGLRTADFSLFVLQIIEKNVIEYLRCLKDINVRRNIIEQEVYQSSRNKDLMKLLNLEKSLVYFVTSLTTISMMLVKLRRLDILKIKDDEDKSDLLEDILIDNNQAQEMGNLYARILNETMEALSSMIANNLNIIIQRLTLITLILMLPTVIASFYGMNVPLPFQHSEWAFYIILGSVVLLGVLLIFIFRRKKLF
jgi:magnesium transporter